MKRKADSQQNQTSKKPKVAYAIENRKNFVADLPAELVREILSYLTEHELRRARLIDTRIFRVVNMSHFKIGLVFDSEMSELTRVFGRYDRPIGLTFRKTNKIEDNMSLLSQLTQLTLLDTANYRGALKLDKLTNLQYLVTLVKLKDIQNFTRLTYLKAVNNQSALPPQIRHFKKPVQEHNMLPSIKYQLTGLEALHTGKAVSDIPINTLTALTILEYFTDLSEYWDYSHLTNLRQLHHCGYEFLIGRIHLLSFKLLESLTIEYGIADCIQYNQLIQSNITHLHISLAQPEIVRQIMTFTNLRQLHLNLMPKLNDIFAIDLEEIGLSRLIQLTSLKILVQDSALHSDVKSINFSPCLQLTNLYNLAIKQVASTEDNIKFPVTMARLTKLTVENARSIDVIHLTNLQRLDAILDSFSLEGWSALSNLTHLEYWGRSKGTRSIFTFTALRSLTIHRNPLTDRQIESLSRFEHLTYLYCQAREGGASVTRLTRLQKLKLFAHKSVPELDKQLNEKLIYCNWDYETRI